MKDRINVAELLRDCPMGTELYSPIYGNGILTKVTDRIHVKFPKEHNVKCFRPDGRVSEDGEIMIFPKGKTTWEGFHRPFKDGDIAVTDKGDIHLLRTEDSSYCAYRKRWNGLPKFDKTITTSIIGVYRLATEEEKQSLFDAIEENGYRWNADTKTLDKLIEPKFKVGDKIKRKGDTRLTTIKDIRDDYYIITILDLFDNAYITDKLLFINQNEYEIVPDKFDITTLKPFDRVLVRNDDKHVWEIQFFERLNNILKDSFVCMGRERYHQCIPYEGNEHLHNTAEDCDEYFKTWG